MKLYILLLTILFSGMAADEAIAAPAASGPARTLPPSTATYGSPYATPEAAAESYIYARFAKDAVRTRNAVEVPPARKADAEAALDAMITTDALQKEAVAHFGADGRKLFDPDNAGQLAAALAALDKSRVEVNGDKATITGPDDTEGKPSSVTILVKTAAGWKIDGASLLDGGNASEMAERVDLFRKSAEVAKKVTAGISASKYPAASDAYRDYVKLMGQAAQGAMAPSAVPATGAVSGTASAPASRP